jgi:hypothetical protein
LGALQHTWWRNWQQDMSETLGGFSAGCVVRCSTASFGRSDMEDSRSLTVKKL